ncbi:MAG: hypothetical protein H7Z40_16500 [Phycisphaerae bacterium]|nr:hypothetical protein [Gemmatimonadaceae bacterium]
MKSKTTAFAIGAALALGIGANANAGTHTMFPVTINDPAMFADGDVSFVHNTPDVVQILYCESQGTSARCVARNLGLLVRSCSTANPAHLAAIHSIGTDSYVRFSWNAAGQCTLVIVRNGSLTVPKA